MKLYAKIFIFALSGGYLFGYDSILVESKQKPIFQLDFYNQGESSTFGGEAQVSPFTLTDEQKNEVKRAAQFLADILSVNATNNEPIALSVSTMQKANASAISYDILTNGNSALFAQLLYEDLSLQEAKEDLSHIVINQDSQGNPIFLSSEDLKYLWAINIGTLDWYIAPHPSVLPINKNQGDTFSIFTHELFHSLGLGATISNGLNAIFASNLNAYTRHLVDYRGVYAQGGMQIVDDKFYESNRGIFLVDIGNDMWGDNFGGSLSNASGHAYFVGNNVSEVIKNARLGFDAFNGLPISGWENGSAEFSHIELDNSLMSHQSWSNYLYFMEAELALLQDLGYRFDRKLYFGDSIYENGIVWNSTHGFNDRNAQGWVLGSYNPSAYGVGLHIYGKENVITQNHNILSRGIAASGIRIDGSDNTLNLASGTKIHMLGDYSSGVLVAYGKNHTLNHNGEIIVEGKEGIGIHIDFGDNEIGNNSEYRGSYMFANPDYEEIEFQDFLEAYRLNGALVSNLNLGNKSYTQGDLAAIYIADNAFVENINIQMGATIKGDIISLWNPNNSKLLQGYANQFFTTLNFENLQTRQSNPVNAFVLEGGIYGYNSFKVKVNGDLVLKDNAWVYDLYNSASLKLENSNASIKIKNHFENATNATLNAPINPQGKLNIQLGNSAALDGNLKFYMAKGFYGDKLQLDRENLFDTNSGNTTNISGKFATIAYDDSTNLSHTLKFHFDNLSDTIEITRDYMKFATNEGDKTLASALESLAFKTEATNPTSVLFEEIDFTRDTQAITRTLENLNATAYVNTAKASLDFQQRLNQDFLNDFRKDSNRLEWLVQVIPFGNYSYTKENGDFSAYRGYGGGIHTSAIKNFNDSWNMGLHFIANSSYLEFQNNLESNVKSKGGYAGVTTRYDLENFYLFGSLRVGYENNELNRAINVGSYTQNFSANFNTLVTSTFVGIGKDFIVSDALSFLPFGYIEYNILHTPNITEKQDSNLALRVKSKDYYSLGSFVGAKIEYHKNFYNSVFNLAFLGGYYYFFNDELKVDASFKGDSNSTFYAQNVLNDKSSLRMQVKTGLSYQNGFFTNLSLQSDIKSRSDFYGKLEAGIRF